jgi:hypothetical protein
MNPVKKARVLWGVMLSLCSFITMIGLGSASGEGEKPKAPEEESIKMVLIVKVRESGGELRPLGGATVNVCDSQGSKHQNKTTGEGIAVFKGLSRGKARVQVIAPECEPFGKDYELTQSNHEIPVEIEKRKP